MAMTDCRDCGQPVSTKAATCPHCGARQGLPENFIAKAFIIGLLVLLVAGMLLGG